MKMRATIAALAGVMLLTTVGGASAVASQSTATTSAAAVTRAGSAAAAPHGVRDTEPGQQIRRASATCRHARQA